MPLPPRSCVLGFAYPGYKTFKVLKRGDVLAQREWLKYWCVLGLAAVLSLLTDLVVGAFLPGYGLLKLGVVVALVAPTTRGYARVWAVVEPHLAAQEGAIDGAVARAMDATASARSTGAARANAAMAQGRAAAMRQAEGVKKRATAGRGGGRLAQVAHRHVGREGRVLSGCCFFFVLVLLLRGPPASCLLYIGWRGAC